MPYACMAPCISCALLEFPDAPIATDILRVAISVNRYNYHRVSCSGHSRFVVVAGSDQCSDAYVCQHSSQFTARQLHISADSKLIQNDIMARHICNNPLTKFVTPLTVPGNLPSQLRFCLLGQICLNIVAAHRFWKPVWPYST